MAEKNSEKANAAGGLGEEEAHTDESVVNSNEIEDSAPRLEQKKEKALGESPGAPRLEEQDFREKRAAGEVEGLKKNLLFFHVCDLSVNHVNSMIHHSILVAAP